MMCHIEVIDDTLYIEDDSLQYSYDLGYDYTATVAFKDSSILISNCVRIQYPHSRYWKIETVLRPRSEARLYMRGGNDAYECAEKPQFIVVHHDEKTILEKDFY